jgi:GAF domain-containing protein
VDGVALMEELRRASPSSDAIVFTGYDVEEGLRAFDAGAYRYLTKPFDTRELVRILTVLQRERETRRERDWLHVLSEIAWQMQQADDVHALADVIVRGGLRFGFRRARLRLFEQAGQEAAGDPEMVGVSQAGEPLVQGFEGLRTPLSRLLYSQQAIAAGRPLVFDGRKLGPGGNDEFYAAQSVPLPRGHWFKIPLFNGSHPVGTLTLDNGDEERFFGPDVTTQLTQVLSLFGNQAADALERARLHGHTKILSEIGRQVTTRAAGGKLDSLLDEVRTQVGRLMDVTNFMVVLSDLETGDLDFRRQYEEGALFDRHWRTAHAGLSGRVIDTNRPLLVADTMAYCRSQGITHYGRPAQCWLGVPLRVEGQAVGALAVQSYLDRSAYDEHHQHLLAQVADQVAGAIHLAYQLERQDELRRQDDGLAMLKGVMPGLIQESDDNFWHAVLTMMTHRDGNSFNRALLFWYRNDGMEISGRMGIGYFTCEEACKAWEADRDEGRSLQEYFAAPHLARLHPTPLQQAITDWRLPTTAPEGPCFQVWQTHRRLICASTELRGCLPDDVVMPTDLLDGAQSYRCALLPLKSGDGTVGLLIVDNAFDGEPLRDGDLDKVERVLEAAMEAWRQAGERDQARRLGESYEKVLSLSRRITAQAAVRPLKESLEELCGEAQALTGADCVVIYPYRATTGGYELDLVTHTGLQRVDEFQAKTKDKPRQQGVTFSILQSGTLVVPDVDRDALMFGGRRLAEHDFLQREAVKALIGTPMRQAATGEPLGVLYLDYRSSRSFTPQDVALAEHIAGIGATVIHYAREMERETQGRTAAERDEQQRRRDMQLLSNIQMQALAADSDEEKVIRSILRNAVELFGRPIKATLALLNWEGDEQQTRQVRWDYRLDDLGRLRKRRMSRDQGLLGQALDNPGACLAGNNQACAIRRGQESIGAILLQKPSGRMGFTFVEKEIIERLATVAALALDNVRTRAHLQVVSETVAAVSKPTELQETLEKVVASARQVAPDIDCVTLWYADIEDRERLIPGPQWGVSQEKHRGPQAHTDRVVREVMKLDDPLFAPVVERERYLEGEFIRDEKIVSAAAFPLRFGTDDPRALGALFLNYRKAHEFTPIEQALFKIFADAAATAIHDAQTLDRAERRRKRLETALAVATSAGATLDLDEVLRGILTALRDEFQRDPADDTRPYIMLYNERDNALELPRVAREFYRPDRPEYQARVRLPLDGPGITPRTARRALAERKIVADNVKDVHADPAYEEVNSETESEICAGLVSGERLLGALVIKSNRRAAFDAEDEKLFEMAAHQVAIALDRLDRAARVERDASVAGAVAWAADIAHDLKSTVGLIRNRAYWLLQREADLSEQGKVWAEQIDQYAVQIAQMGQMAHDVGLRRKEPECFALEEMLCERIASWKSTRSVQVALEVNTTEPCLVSAHREPLWRAIRHLLRNAVEAMEAAGSQKREIRVRLLSPAQGHVEIQIEDTGPGIPEETRQYLFIKPYPSKAAGQSKYGLGLLLAQWLIEPMNGSIYLYPAEPDHGARFGIRLPLATK